MIHEGGLEGRQPPSARATSLPCVVRKGVEGGQRTIFATLTRLLGSLGPELRGPEGLSPPPPQLTLSATSPP